MRHASRIEVPSSDSGAEPGGQGVYQGGTG